MGMMGDSSQWNDEMVLGMLWSLVFTFWIVVGVRSFLSYVMMKFYQEGKVLAMQDGGPRDQAAHPCRQ